MICFFRLFLDSALLSRDLGLDLTLVGVLDDRLADFDLERDFKAFFFFGSLVYFGVSLVLIFADLILRFVGLLLLSNLEW